MANCSSANIKVWKTRLPKILYSREFTILSSLIEGSTADLFLQRLAKKELLNPKEGWQNLAVDVWLDTISRKRRKDVHQEQVQQETLTNNKTKDIMKLIRSLENEGILLKATPEINNQEVEFLNFF